MSETVIVAMVSLFGTLLGSLMGILTANKLTNYRIDQLESSITEIKKDLDRINKLESHNQLQDSRMEAIEKDVKRIMDHVEV